MPGGGGRDWGAWGSVGGEDNFACDDTLYDGVFSAAFASAAACSCMRRTTSVNRRVGDKGKQH